MKKILFYSVLLFTVFSISCEEDSEPEVESGSLVISISNEDQSNGRTENEIPTKAVLTIEDSDGAEVVSSEEFEVVSFGSGYAIEPILLEIGDYDITEFLVLNSDDEVIYATPLEGSTLASLVENPLPISFSISSDQTTDVTLEVISTEGLDPEDLGYATLSFEIVPTKDILVSVFELVSGTDSYEFVSSQVTVYADSDSINTVALGDSINVLKLRSDFDDYVLTFSVDGYDDISVGLSADTLDYYRTTPLQVEFSASNDTSDLSAGLIAHYAFSGNANDSGENGLDGVLGDGAGSNEPTLTSDRDGAGSSAYNFDGDAYIDLSEDPIFDLGDNEEFSISTWINPSDTTNGIIVSKYLSPSDNRMWLVRIWDGNIRFNAYDNGGQTNDQLESPVLSGWHHVAVVLDNDVFSLYVNGELKTSTAKTVSIKDNSPTTKALIGAVHFSNVLFDRKYTGDIDEVRLYNRALTTDEVELLAAE